MSQDQGTPDVTRRRFLTTSATTAATVAGLSTSKVASAEGAVSRSTQPGQPENIPEVDFMSRPIDAETIGQAQKLAAMSFDTRERSLIAGSIERQIETYKARRTHTLANGVAPATVFRPPLPNAGTTQGSLSPSTANVPTLPSNEVDIAFAPVTWLSKWIHNGDISSRRLTEIYLERLHRFDPQLECVITFTDTLALQQADAADQELAAGRSRGPLHGIPWGAKDLLDTRNIKTTWGAGPYRDRVADSDATVVTRLRDAGAVLVAKLTLGELAYGDLWFGGQTKNPWNLNQGSSGSSAGSACATAAGLVGFSIGTETWGSIVSPCMRCGATGLRPTFGRVARTGAMALCWSLDKIGPICRRVEDTAMVLDAIHGHDAGDEASVDVPFAFDAAKPLSSIRMGVDPKWFEGRVAPLDHDALAKARQMGVEIRDFEMPNVPHDGLVNILHAEAAAAFEELTHSNRDDDMKMQEPNGWPNQFRRSWFIPAIEFVQAQRVRRQACEAMNRVFEDFDVLIAPSYAANLLLITNFTGHPSLTIRTGVRSNNRPHGITLIGRLWDEGTLCRAGMALEEALNVWQLRPELTA